MAEIIFDNVKIVYKSYHKNLLSLRRSLVSLVASPLARKKHKPIESITALHDISFKISAGDRVGIIGNNGSGKSTLLRAMAGIYAPSQGTVRHQGEISTMFHLGAGLHEDLNGYENIKRLLCYYPKSCHTSPAVVKKIAEFSDLGDFLNLPVRTYSSGMKMRLSFSTCIGQNPQILLIDEIFGTGDAKFQQQTKKFMTELLGKSSIFVLASHNQKLIDSLCTRVFLLDKGKLTEL